MPSRFEPVGAEVLSAALHDDPGHRLPPEDYYARLQPHLAGFGITRIADITGLDRLGYPVAQAIRPMARSNAVTQGKADTPVAAALGAALECLEMAAGEDVDHLPETACPEPGLWAPMAPGAVWPTDETAFVAAWDLTRDRAAAVPRDLLSTDFARGAAAERAPVLRVSVGLGAGATLAAALMHGLLETLEADARNRAAASGRERRIALDTGDATAGALLGRIARAGLRVAVSQLADDPVVVMKASVMEPPERGGLPLPAVGYAARREAGAAIHAAVAEAVQARLAVISGAREDITRRFYAHSFTRDELAAEWDRHGPCRGSAIRSAPETDLRALCGRVGPVFAVPLCWRPDLPLAIARVLAPGLIVDPLRLEQGP